MTTTTQTIHWRKLIVSTGNAAEGTELGIVTDTDDSSLLYVQVENGRIVSWPQFYISAPGEDPDWNTPSVPVDWTGFGQAVQTVRRHLGA